MELQQGQGLAERVVAFTEREPRGSGKPGSSFSVAILSEHAAAGEMNESYAARDVLRVSCCVRCYARPLRVAMPASLRLRIAGDCPAAVSGQDDEAPGSIFQGLCSRSEP